MYLCLYFWSWLGVLFLFFVDRSREYGLSGQLFPLSRRIRLPSYRPAVRWNCRLFRRMGRGKLLPYVFFSSSSSSSSSSFSSSSSASPSSPSCVWMCWFDQSFQPAIYLMFRWIISGVGCISSSHFVQTSAKFFNWFCFFVVLFLFYYQGDVSVCETAGCQHGCKPAATGPLCFCRDGRQPNGTDCIGIYTRNYYHTRSFLLRSGPSSTCK